ncbi:hypothetical protein QW71_20065 [Paenibacillus sp. IHB B 3415]|uniref:hypothetical protein n=1 Tax=Paenibacillus sp. IHB B 3415 TaxID=867080 RepID=UPI0005755827|nr:hypothetical protein [Paenibacillus sp. IHB B 3415]KHL94103.1 hypothetical protein QW71_20065 [Paenibacillus sp. IHB B 3415]
MEVKVKDTFAQMLLFKRKIEIDPGGAFSFWNEYIDSCAADGLNTEHLNFEKVISKVLRNSFFEKMYRILRR